MTPEEKILYRFLDYGISVLEEQIKNDEHDVTSIEEALLHQEREASLQKLKQQIKELKNGKKRSMD